MRVAFTHIPLHRSLPLGAGAYVVGYLLTVGVIVGRVDEVLAVVIHGRDGGQQSLGQLLGTVPSPWVVGAWVFYNAQLIPTSVPLPSEWGGSARLTNKHLLLAADGGLLILYVVPPLLLTGAGYLVVRTGPTYGAAGELYAGASIALVYLLLLVVGAFVFAAKADGILVTPAGLQTVWLGLVYPTVFGALGGILAGRRWPGGRAESRSERQRGGW